MKRLISVLFVVVIFIIFSYLVYDSYATDNMIELEDEIVSISEYYIYGDHLNIKGNLILDDLSYKDVSLTLFNGKEYKDIDVVYENDGNKINFYISKNINDGMYLDEIPRGKYCFLLKLTYGDDLTFDKFYGLKNNTKYNNTVYYTMSKYNNKIIIDSDRKYNTMILDVSENNDDNIYDITIDPGHGGIDGGAVVSKYKEADFTMDVSVKIRDILEKNGFKVKMTHDALELTKNDFFDYYNEHGRAVIPNEVKSKYTFSIHYNYNDSKNINGVEIYTASDINYDLAKMIATNLVDNTKLRYSNNKMYKMFNGVYTRNFNDGDIASSLQEYKEKNYVPYNLSKESNYYFMIRETGGYMTGAYVDNRNIDRIGFNPYYNSNVGNESYLLELGYLSNSGDLSYILDNSGNIASAVAGAIIEYFDK